MRLVTTQVAASPSSLFRPLASVVRMVLQLAQHALLVGERLQALALALAPLAAPARARWTLRRQRKCAMHAP